MGQGPSTGRQRVSTRPRDFLGRPAKDSLFAMYGGRQTALSYGVEADFSSQWSARQAADQE